ncbi:MAG: two-component system response regulator [Pseudobdellovibrio sp.]|jgi:DNA-binding response OmpR family regulator|nr:two-component system response regulator [Pseudobdellovibrio sp.]
MKKVLVIEDNVETQNLLKKYLQHLYDLRIAPDLHSAWELIEKEDWDVILLDRGLPDGDGLEICAKLKRFNMDGKFPVIVLTASSELEEKIKGLTAGADDYVIKPFEPRELLTRIEVVLRRRNTPSSFQSTITLANIIVDLETHTASARVGENETVPLDLTPIEFKILLALIRNYGNREISRDTLISSVWDKVNLSMRNIDTHICHLRKKIARGNLQIKNKRNKGYYLKKDASAEVVPVATPVLPQQQLNAF